MDLDLGTLAGVGTPPRLQAGAKIVKKPRRDMTRLRSKTAFKER
jgi:hypothetical protein